MQNSNYIAIDLGATSGRTILGTLSEGKLSLKELTRFPNSIIELGGHYHWNIFSLYEELKRGLKEVVKQGLSIDSIGIDTWGVDFAFIGSDGAILGMPYAYRDPHTSDAPNEYFNNIMSREEVYKRTGIQVMNFNSLYQLYTLNKNKSSQLHAANKIAFIPDVLSYMLTGEIVTEYTIASTSQINNPYTKELDSDLLQSVGLSAEKFGRMVMPGDKIGTLRKELAEECGLPQLPVVAVAGHDTASAVASVPALSKNFAYLSSGTWSLMGIEVDKPVISDVTAKWNITNEGGVEGTIRLLKNITGMWIVEQCLKEWKSQGVEYSYPEMVAMAQNAPAFVAMIDPDDSLFANPQSMVTAIDSYIAKTNQQKPQSPAEYIRVIFESLALKYKYVLGMFLTLSENPIDILHIIGGGSKNAFLNQLTANSIGLPVIAGPSEATAIGNIMIQAKSAGVVSSLAHMREVIAECINKERFTPQNQEVWEQAYKQFKTIIDNEFRAN